MSTPSVSIHPYFKIRADRLDAAKALLPQFVARTRTEPTCQYYEFTIGGDVIFCREAYDGAEGALAHLANVGDLLAELLTLGELARLEIHGPAEELAKLKEPLASYQPAWFAYECGLPPR